jgi:hypothetical protein
LLEKEEFMRESYGLKWPILLLLLAALCVNCGGEKLCCHDEDRVTSTAERQYCLNHTDAARLWIQTPTDESQWRSRLATFTSISDNLDDCTTIDCIEQALQSEDVPDDLWSRYEDEHADAEDRLESVGVSLTDTRKAELIKCGFSHAIQVGLPE